jgi:2-polyprenyl-3-methyl-5-hydroxy-6-metoxy-1,4-benzoquinol methylase
MLFNSDGICPVCQTSGEIWCKTMDWEYRTTDELFTYLRCPKCGTIFVLQVSQDLLSQIYPSNYYSFNQKPERAVFRMKNWIDARFYRKILKQIAGPALSLLDVGGGSGQSLDILRKADRRISYTEIVDINPGAEIAALKKGHQYTLSTIEDFNTEKKYDVILLFNLVEHLANPSGVLQKLEKMLFPGGKIILKTPNAESWDARIFQNAYWGGLHTPRHWIIFSDFSFRKMIQTTGLTIEKMAFTQGATFWTFSLLQVFRAKNIQLKKKPLIEHVLFSPLCVFFATLDKLRGAFSKTSQMFIVLSK